MSEEQVSSESNEPLYRCPSCDSVVAVDADHCLMCGSALTADSLVVDDASDQSQPTPVAEQPILPADDDPQETVNADTSEEELHTTVEEEATTDLTGIQNLSGLHDTVADETTVFESTLRERQSPVVFLLTAVFAILIVLLGALLLRYPAPQDAWAFVPTETPFPPTPTYTPVWTPLPTKTAVPSLTPTITPTPRPSDTPQPPRFHAVASGETLIGLALRYRVSAESIATTNNFGLESPIQVGQDLEIPWPTPTPDLPYIPIEINGEVVLAVAEGCELYQVQADDTAFGIAARYDVPIEALQAVNWHTPDSIALIQPGDVLCIPGVEYNLNVLPPTPGPSPTARPTDVAPGPALLYPVAETVVDQLETAVVFQWVGVKDLADDEWYMIELKDMDELDGLPFRGFTRDNGFRAPSSWRPVLPELRRMRWRVSIVKVTGERQDGRFLYTFAGEASDPAFFTWLGAIPTATPTPTATPSPTPAP